MTMKETWKPVTIGGMTGILMGAGTMLASQKLTTDEMPVVESNRKPLLEASVGESQSFREAFQAARAELGAGGVFRWHGNIYNTYTVEEWNAMSTEEKNLFVQRVKPEVSPADIDTNQIAQSESADNDVKVVSEEQELDAIEEKIQETVAAANTEESGSVDEDVQEVSDQQGLDAIEEKIQETVAVANTEESGSVDEDVQEVSDKQGLDAIGEKIQETVVAANTEESESVDEDVQMESDKEELDAVEENSQATATVNSTDDDDVRVIGYGDIDMADGRFITVEELEINGQRVAVIDVDKDGVGDFAMSDLNHNQRADEGEVIDLHTGDVISFQNNQTAMDDSSSDVDLDINPA